MSIRATYLDMPLSSDDLDGQNREYFRHRAEHIFHLQQCDDCKLLRYPPTPACPWCTSLPSTWTAVEGQREVYSSDEGRQGIQPAFQARVPYMVLLVELDTQNGRPTEHEALRVIANLTTADGIMAPPDVVRRVGIGSRMRMVFSDVGPGLSLPQWTIDESATQPANPWR